MRLSIRFQPWIATLSVVLVLLLTASFLLTVFGKFQSVAEVGAQQKFALIAQSTQAQLNAQLGSHRRLVEVLSGSDPSLFERNGALEPDALVPTLLAALDSNSDLYSVYVGLENGEFLQAIAVRNQPAVLKALAAPPSTEFALRRIQVGEPGQRTERWHFMGLGKDLLGMHEQLAQYDPRSRAWYQGARASGQVFLAEAYRFASTGELGLTLAAPLGSGRGVLGADILLASFSAFLDRLELSPNAAVMAQNADGKLIGLSVRGTTQTGMTSDWALKRPAELGAPTLVELDQFGGGTSEGGETVLHLLGGVPHVVAQHLLEPVPGTAYRVIALAPMSDFTRDVLQARRDVLLAAAVILALLVPLSLLGTRQVSRALRSLAQSSERLRRLDFAQRPEVVKSFLYEVNALGEAQQVMHDSLRDRTAALELAKKKLAAIVDVGIRMGREKDHQALLRHVLFGARDIAHCQAATLLIKTEHNTLRFALRTSDDPLPDFEIPLYDAKTGEPVHQFVSAHVALTGQSVVIDDVYTETRFDLSGTKRFSEESGLRVVSMLTVPLFPREGEVIGLLQLINCQDIDTRKVVPFDPETVGFIEALATQSAITIENQQLLQAQQALLDAMIKIIAGAIDAKSPYTGGHCERVPELALMLAEQAAQVQHGPLADFGFKTQDEWQEFRIGAWLHDCGKVITPEYVVDKATKLETIYNRIHEVRTRFEVLLRDAEIATHKAIAAGQDAASAWAQYEERKQQLQDDFAFLAESNVGGEYMAPERLERLRTIASQTWWRHFDDRLGLSHEEEQRAAAEPVTPLPAEERLLSDKARHIFPRGPERALDPKYGFQVKVPQHLYNHGELYNLSIARGTLTEEERFKINEHIIQTIVMLENLPFPKHLRRVPEYAGTHHETLVGSGYPRKLKAEQLSVPARIMAIADIFEALTASDRPYKKAKTLSEAVKILSFFKKDGHIDPVLFDLFLTSGVYRQYAERFLLPEQMDEVDITAYVG